MNLESNRVFDEAYERGRATWALGVTIVTQDNQLAQMQTKDAPGEMLLKPCRGPHVSHATATRPAKYSVIPITDDDLARSRTARIIYSLPHPMPSAISWRCHPNEQARRLAGSRLANYVAELFSDRQRSVELRAGNMAHAIVRPGGVARPNELPWLWMPHGVWRDSGERKTWNEVEREILTLETDALRAMWENC